MARTLDDMPSANRGFPNPGEHECVVLSAVAGRSKTKKTPQIELCLSTGERDFEDQLFVTLKTISRLSLVAGRVAGMPKDYQLPDDDSECANVLAKYIASNVVGKRCIVVIEESEETWIPESGPDMGRKMTRMRRRVAFGGYKKIDPKQEHQKEETQPENDDLPF